MRTDLDPRTHAVRADLADVRLEGLVEAQRFVAGTPGQVRTAFVPMYARPGFDAPRVSEALSGEMLRVYERHAGWAWVQLETDGYVGYVPDSAITSRPREMTHKVTALTTFLYRAPDIKSEMVATLSLNAMLAIVGEEAGFLRLHTGGFVVQRHARLIGETAPDWVATAERLVGQPYLWGGRTGAGVDCSGLVQLAMMAAGIDCPRDSDMQQAALGRPVDIGTDLSGLRRGDLLFWKGHVGIMRDGLHLLHANAHHMEVAVEPVVAAVARIAAAGSRLLAVKRLESR